MNEFRVKARLSIDEDVPIGYQIKTSDAMAWTQEGIDLLQDLLSRYKDAMKNVHYEHRAREDEKDRERAAARKERDSIHNEIISLKELGKSWFSDRYIHQGRIDALCTKLSGLRYAYPRNLYIPEWMYVSGNTGIVAKKLQDIQELISIVVSDTITLNEEQAMLMSRIKSGKFQAEWEETYKSNFGSALS